MKKEALREAQLEDVRLESSSASTEDLKMKTHLHPQGRGGYNEITFSVFKCRFHQYLCHTNSEGRIT